MSLEKSDPSNLENLPRQSVAGEIVELDPNLSMLREREKPRFSKMRDEQTPVAVKPLKRAVEEHNRSGIGDPISMEQARFILRTKIRNFLNGEPYIPVTINIRDAMKDYLNDNNQRKVQRTLDNAVIGFLQQSTLTIVHAFSTNFEMQDPLKENTKKLAAEIAIKHLNADLEPEVLLDLMSFVLKQVVSLDTPHFAPNQISSLLESCKTKPTSAQRMAIAKLIPNETY